MYYNNLINEGYIMKKIWLTILLMTLVFASLKVSANTKGIITMDTIAKIKQPSVAGTFYTADKTALEKQITEFKKKAV